MQTVLAGDDRAELGAVTLWRQCVDLLAQHDRADRAPMAAADRAALLDRLNALRPKVSETQRMATVVELGTRLRSATLAAFFSDDRPSIAAAAMARAQLPDEHWASLVPGLSPTARGVLRGRRDMGIKAMQALEAFGPADLVLTTDRQHQADDALLLTVVAPDAPTQTPRSNALPMQKADAPAGDGGQIRALVERIARFTSERRPPASPASGYEAPPMDAVRAFAFETDAAGVVRWVDAGPRAALIGLSLGEAGLGGDSGPDGHVAGAFARRSGFQNGRFTIVGGAMAGEWRMTASPFFDPASGRFQGYRGQARRPYLYEVAAQPAAAPTALTGLSADSLRQLVHELRTPLNAILGFAEIIEQELFGPAGPQYRGMAGNIAVDARHLLAAFDDLDLAARVSRADRESNPRPIDFELLVAQVAARFREQGGVGAPRIDIAIARDLPQAKLDPVQGERMVQHLLRTLISVAPQDEALTGACWLRPDGGEGRVVLAIDRPSSLTGMDEAQLFDPGYDADGDWVDGPLLGLGFSLRLIRGLASAGGGCLEVEAGRFLLVLPAALASDGAADSA
nr:HAMP domain-containing sensor histidine kinase [Sphingobium sp. OAS761]